MDDPERYVWVTNERLFVFLLAPIRLAKVFRKGCVGYPRRYTIRGLNGAQSRVRTDRSCLPHDKSARHSGVLQMTSAPAYNWYVSNQYLDTRDTGYRDSRNVCFWLAVATAAATRSVPQLLGSLQRCSGINYYPSSPPIVPSVTTRPPNYVSRCGYRWQGGILSKRLSLENHTVMGPRIWI